jgi:uncharacterized protein
MGLRNMHHVSSLSLHRNRSSELKQLKGFLTGLAGGTLGGLFGVGGGAVMIPLLTSFSKLTQHQAHGTSLFAIFFTAAVGAATYYVHGDADWVVALVITASAIFTARLGARYAHSLPEKRLRKSFGIFLLFATAMLLVKGYLPAPAHPLGVWGRLMIFLFTGSLAGFLSGMMGVGGGVIMVPFMVILANMTQHVAQGTSLLAMIPMALSGVRAHHKLGNVRMDVAWGLAGGALAGGYAGAMAAKSLPEVYLRTLFVCFTIWMNVRYLKG